MKLVIVIPHYNHSASIENVLLRLAPFKLPCIVIDDGSNPAEKLALETIVAKFPWVTLIMLDINLGKGSAVMAGIKWAQKQQYTHIFQIDADGQHDLSDVPKFLNTSKRYPNALITGTPIYDASVPKSRLYGRRITNFWACLEALSYTVRDAMCGFRIYPLAYTLTVINKYSIGKRMDFDIEIIVRLAWQGVKILSIPSKVIYPAKGISHFNLWQDNLRISWLHARLFCGMFIRLPMLVRQKYKRKQQKKAITHWSSLREVGTLLGLKTTLLSYKFLGRRLSYCLLYPVITYFYWFNSLARGASKQYLTNLTRTYPEKGTLKKYSSYQHFICFAQTIIDKLAAWNHDITLEQIDFPNKNLLQKCVAQKRGGIILTAHLGNIDVARAIARIFPNLKINAVVFNQHALNINAILTKINPGFSFNLIQAQKLDMPLAIQLHEKIAQGEFIVIAADRTSTTHPQRMIKANFLNNVAYFPQGAFVLAGLLKYPLYFMLCLKQKKQRYLLEFEEFAQSITIERSQRQEQLKFYAQKYADILADYCQHYPLQWFNFFNFWQTSAKQKSRELRYDN